MREKENLKAKNACHDAPQQQTPAHTQNENCKNRGRETRIKLPSAHKHFSFPSLCAVVAKICERQWHWMCSGTALSQNVKSSSSFSSSSMTPVALWWWWCCCCRTMYSSWKNKTELDDYLISVIRSNIGQSAPGGSCSRIGCRSTVVSKHTEKERQATKNKHSFPKPDYKNSSSSSSSLRDESIGCIGR